ncbi:MAG TPA: SemiSWEET transporter [Chryseolinea sp.]
MDDEKFTEIIGIAAGICTGVSLLPQIIKMVREKKAHDISLFYLLVLLLGLSLWTYYGILKNDIPIIATNAFSMVLNMTMIVLGTIYKRREQPVR